MIIETTIFSSAYRIFTKIHIILGHRENISRFHNGNITKTLISAGKLDTKNKTTNKQAFLLEILKPWINAWVQGKIKREITEFLKNNDNENTYQYLSDIYIYIYKK